MNHRKLLVTRKLLFFNSLKLAESHLAVAHLTAMIGSMFCRAHAQGKCLADRFATKTKQIGPLLIETKLCSAIFWTHADCTALEAILAFFDALQLVVVEASMCIATCTDGNFPEKHCNFLKGQ